MTEEEENRTDTEAADTTALEEMAKPETADAYIEERTEQKQAEETGEPVKKASIGDKRHAITPVLAAQHPNDLVGGRGCRIALGTLRGITA